MTSGAMKKGRMPSTPCASRRVLYNRVVAFCSQQRGSNDIAYSLLADPLSRDELTVLDTTHRAHRLTLP